MEELVCKECKGRKFRKISATEYECEYCGAVCKDTSAASGKPQIVIVNNAGPKPIETPFPPEISYHSGLREGINTQKGRLAITPDKFMFIPNSIHNTGNLSTREWKISDIEGYTKGALAFLDIKMNNRKSIHLSITNRSKIISELEERRKFWAKHNVSKTEQDSEVSSSFGRILGIGFTVLFLVLIIYGLLI